MTPSIIHIMVSDSISQWDQEYLGFFFGARNWRRSSTPSVDRILIITPPLAGTTALHLLPNTKKIHYQKTLHQFAHPPVCALCGQHQGASTAPQSRSFFFRRVTCKKKGVSQNSICSYLFCAWHNRLIRQSNIRHRAHKLIIRSIMKSKLKLRSYRMSALHLVYGVAGRIACSLTYTKYLFWGAKFDFS